MPVVRPVYHGLALSVGLAVLAVLCCAGPAGAALTEENLVSMVGSYNGDRRRRHRRSRSSPPLFSAPSPLFSVSPTPIPGDAPCHLYLHHFLPTFTAPTPPRPPPPSRPPPPPPPKRGALHQLFTNSSPYCARCRLVGVGVSTKRMRRMTKRRERRGLSKSTAFLGCV